jgi:hypothetical protein
VISSLRGRCPKPLDECATEQNLAGHPRAILNFTHFDLFPG